MNKACNVLKKASNRNVLDATPDNVSPIKTVAIKEVSEISSPDQRLVSHQLSDLQVQNFQTEVDNAKSNINHTF